MKRYLASVAAGSQRTLVQSLEVLAALHVNLPPGSSKVPAVKWERLRQADVEAIAAKAATAFAPATANKMLSILRGVLRACRDLKLMSEAECIAAVSVPNVPVTWHPAEISLLSATHVRQLLEACAAKTAPAGRRDAALLAIFLSSGLRRAEAAMLDVSDVREGGNRLRIRSSEQAGEHREVPLSTAERKYLADWLQAVKDVEGLEPATASTAPLLLAVNKSGRIQHRRLTDQAIYNMIRSIGREAELPKVTSRALRLTYVINLIAKGLPVERVQALVGHASWVTTVAYRDLARRAAADGFRPFDLPYVKPHTTPRAPKGGHRE